MDFKIEKDYTTNLHDKHWQFCVGSCHAPMAHRVDYLRQLKFIYEELGIKRIRFHGLFNEDMKVGMTLRNLIPIPSAKKFKEISFFQIGKIFDNLLEIGIKPFVELGFMPKILASGKRQCAFEYKGNITMPKSLNEWSNFIKDFINFLIDRYGKDEVASWYFEVWNEPNLPVFFAGSKKDYFKLYEATSKAIKAIDDRIQIGGPSTANCAWISDFLEYCRETKSPCDFVSTHQYAGDPIGHVFRIGPIIKEMLRRYKDFRKSKGGGVLEGTRKIFVDTSEAITNRNILMDNLDKMIPQAKGLPIYYTEWNVSATCTGPINDTRAAASYAIRTVLASEGKMAGSSFWTFSDLFEELQFYPDPFSGAFGMINNYGIPKPSFYAFKLLSMLGDKRIQLEENNEAEVEMAAFIKDDTMQILLYKQNFFLDEGELTECNLSIYFDKEPSNVYVHKITSKHCNPLAVWERMGAPKYLKPEEVNFIKENSSLVKESVDFKYVNNEIIINAKLYNNDVHLFEIL